jgi:hypothetical protein
LAKDLPKTLYQKEGRMNGFEEKIINEVANLPNIQFWTRNLEKRGFRINGFINHYPDFIIQTKSGKTIILETKATIWTLNKKSGWEIYGPAKPGIISDTIWCMNEGLWTVLL